MTEALILEARGLTMRFGGVTAVDGVDLKVRPGELRCLIGPNGAGKSTFFKMLSGQLRPSAGDVVFKGISLVGLPASRIARLGIGIKTQVPSVFNGLTVAAGVTLAARRSLPPMLARARTDETLARIGIGRLRDRLVGELAHGQRQLVELAMVLAPQPDLVLLDEPAAGMTADEVSRLADLVVELTRSSAVIIVEHDMQFIRRIARDVTVFNCGRVLAEGPAGQVLADQRVKDVYLGKEAA
ncbi:ATP-binding cassette domain-containing protein [Chelatococcus reniformis]|uniref:ABC transporter ATP-binding protein n=1 Tax=Chelatococcus reniformis TaxID=1494448 RepID=A0A916XNZ4_9HYPH|nr:ATP-binding cassette domain-containing protein [Chelatococcus reniformis]GGC87124.1 ABC transporter ATP-binding protein [Chelatococcus reniformis]